MCDLARRSLLNRLLALGGVLVLPPRLAGGAGSTPLHPFRLSVISDELTQDFEQALKIMKGYGLSWVELRGVWNIYNTETTDEQTCRLKDLMRQYGFRLSMLDTALFKCAYPGTERWVRTPDRYPYRERMALLQRAIERAQALGTDKIRIFAFWRVPRGRSYFPRMAEDLVKACEAAHRAGMRLLLENEPACNVATRHEMEVMLKLVGAANLGMNWDVGNAFITDGVTLPPSTGDFDQARIWNIHLKDIRCAGSPRVCRGALVGEGQVDWAGLFRTLRQINYRETLSLEPHHSPPGLSKMDAGRRCIESVLSLMARAGT